MTTMLTVNEFPYEGEGSGTQQSYTRKFEVRFSNGLASNQQAADACGIALGDGHPENLYAQAYSAKATQRNDVQFWDVEFQYKTYGQTFAEQEKWTELDPTRRKPEVSLAWESVRVAIPTDRNGNLIKNSAGQVPDPRFEGDAYFTAYHISTNVATMPDWMDTYRGRYGTTNSTSFRIQLQNGQYKTVAKGCAALRNARSSALKIENNIQFFELSFDLLLRDPPETDTSQEGWVFDMVDQGKMEKKLGTPPTGVVLSSPLAPILGQDGQPVSDPWLLDGAGYGLGTSSGAFNSAHTYLPADPSTKQRADVVTVGDDFYVCIALNAVTSTAPPNDTYWRKVPCIRYWNYLKSVDYKILPACSA